jgi:hypothetical protein
VFRKNNSILVIYTDDTILTDSDANKLDQIQKDMEKEFNIMSQQQVTDFLGVKITRKDGKVILTQPHLIDSILHKLGLQATSNGRDTPALPSVILQKYEDSNDYDEEWHYGAVIRRLNFFENSQGSTSQPKYASVHASWPIPRLNTPRHTSGLQGIIARYLLATKNEGIICNPNDSSFECYCDADFSGNWNGDIAEFDLSTTQSRTGYIVM